MAQAPNPTTEASIPDFPNVRYFIVLFSYYPLVESCKAIYSRPPGILPSADLPPSLRFGVLESGYNQACTQYWLFRFEALVK